MKVADRKQMETNNNGLKRINWLCLDMNKNVLIVANIVNAGKWITFQKCANLFTQMFT